MKTNAAGVALIRGFERLELRAYQDGGWVWTIGWGHTGGVLPGDVWTPRMAETVFLADLKKSESIVNGFRTHTWTENQFSALVSFTFNCGERDLARLIGKPDIPGRIIKYCRDRRGDIEPGLQRRRREELALFLS